MAWCGLMLCAVSGCTPQPSGPKPSAQTSPQPKATATPLPLAATLKAVNAQLFDDKGKPIADIIAGGGTMGPGDKGQNAQGLGTLKRGTATLYQNGKPTAILVADTLRADREKRTVFGSGGVTVRAIPNGKTVAPPPAVRSDTMVWQYDTSVIRGAGNVVFSQGADVQVPGNTFEADTTLETVTVRGNGKPATGNLRAFTQGKK